MSVVVVSNENVRSHGTIWTLHSPGTKGQDGIVHGTAHTISIEG